MGSRKVLLFEIIRNLGRNFPAKAMESPWSLSDCGSQGDVVSHAVAEVS